MRLLIVSDLHIHGTQDPVYHSLLRLIRDRTKEGDILVLAGDIFDLFVGDKKVFCDRYREALTALREASERGAQIHYIEGNHDFLIRGAFRGISRLYLHSREVTLEKDGKRFFIAHGDTVDRSDYRYRALRGFFRSPIMKALVFALPGRWLDEIGNRSSRYSRGRKPRHPAVLPIQRAEELRKIFRSHAAEKLAEGFDFVVLGHCHDLDEMKFMIGDRQGQYINVGYPPLHGSCLAWSPGEAMIQREPLP